MALRSCRVSVTDGDGVSHSVEVQAETLYEAAAAAISIFKDHSWAAAALTPRASLRIEVQLPNVVHAVPVAAVHRWLRSPSTSPKEQLAKMVRERGRS